MSEGGIPFRKRMDFEYGVAAEVTPMVRRIVARNPSGFTFHGTNTYIVGRGRVAVIDPGPMLDEHLEAIVAELQDETVEHIIVTHTHHDHSPAAAPLRDRVGGILWGAHPRPIEDGAKTTESIQWDFAPDKELADGMIVEGDEIVTVTHPSEKSLNDVYDVLESVAPSEPDGTTVLQPIEAVKSGEKTQPWQVDGITGATISSKAIGDILRASTGYMLPILTKQLELLKRNES